METIDSNIEKTTEDLPNFGLVIKHQNEKGTGSGDITLYSYDSYNRLIKTKSQNNSSTYHYNAQGYRTEKIVNNKTTKFLYEGDKVVLETDGLNKQTAFQAYGSNLLYREVVAEGEAKAQSYYYLYNAHGDVTSLIEADGNIAVTYDYDAFGNILEKTGDADNNIGYAGYQYDEESGLYYLNARYYDSITARFISEDDPKYSKKNDPLSLNLYTYCANNPIMYSDPSGHVLKVIQEVSDKAAGSDPLKDYLKEHGINSSQLNGMAHAMGITNYTGTSAQNAKILSTLEKSEASKANVDLTPGPQPTVAPQKPTNVTVPTVVPQNPINVVVPTTDPQKLVNDAFTQLPPNLTAPYLGVLSSPANFAGTIASGTETLAKIAKTKLPDIILNTSRPNDIGPGTWNRVIASEAAALDSKLGTIAKVAKGVGTATIGIDVLNGINNNVLDGAPLDKTISDAVVDTGFGMGGVLASAGSAALAGSLFPGIGTIGGFIAGFGGGIFYMIVTESGGDNSIRNKAKDANYNFINSR